MLHWLGESELQLSEEGKKRLLHLNSSTSTDASTFKWNHWEHWERHLTAKIWSVQNAHEDVLQAWWIKSVATSVGKSSAIVCWTRGFYQYNTHSMEIYTLLCWISRCRVTNYINRPQEICEDAFVMMQLLATMARAHSFYSDALFQTLFHVLSLCCGEICLEQFLQLRLNKKPCPISSTSCTRSYTHL